MKIGFPGALVLIFIVLKLTGVISWSWWWVLSPMWIMLLVQVIVVLSVLIYHEFKKKR
jgi:hypothetical protein